MHVLKIVSKKAEEYNRIDCVLRDKNVLFITN